MGILGRFCSVFLPKPPILGHISEVSFDCGCIKIIDILIFTMENRTVFFLFLLNHLIFEKTELKWALRQFSDESDEKVVRKKAYRLKLEFYNTDRQLKNIIRRIFP